MPTFVEKLIKRLPGPYFFKCLTFWIIFGTPGMVLTRYLDTLNFQTVVELFGVISAQNVIIFSLANFVMPLYAFYGINHMRMKIADTMPQLKQVAVEGTLIEKIFASISKLLPSMVLAVFFAALSIVSLPGQTQHVVGILSFIVKVVGFIVSMIAYGTFVWMYVSSVRGLYRLGREHLRFSSFYEDKHLGMKSFGSVSLSLAWVYFLGIGLVFFSFSPLPFTLLAALFGLIALGIVLFFLPLHEVHVKMKKEKLAVEKALGKRLHQLVETLESNKEDTNEVTDLVAFQIIDQKVSSISVWPFDTVTLSWFSAIIITVLGSIITRYLLGFLGL